MNKIRNFATILLTGGFLATFSLWAFLKPADNSSLSERRLLAQFPNVSPLDSTFSSKFDLYATDQFPLRDLFRSVKANTALSILRQLDNHDIYLVDGNASEIDYPLSEESLDHAAERFRFIYDKFLTNAHGVYYSVIPDKNVFLAADNGYPAVDFGELCQKLDEKLDFAENIDISDLLSIGDYYRTDTHWNQEKLLKIAKRLAGSMGVELKAEYQTVTLDIPFYGVYCGRSGLSLKPDQISYLTNDLLESLTVYDYETDSEIPVYDLEKTTGRDPYEMFLSGSKSLLTVENPDAENKRGLVIFRDSFGSSLSPLLFEGWSKVTIADIRYISPSVLGQFIDFDGFDVLFIYSSSVLNNSETIK